MLLTNVISGKKKKFTLRKKINIALGCVMFLSVLVTFFVSNYIFQRGAEKSVINNARFLLTTIEASRTFTSKVVKPVLYKEIPGRFIVEGMSSSFGARNIFDGIKEKYPDYYFKHACPNPRNKLNLADKFELAVIKREFSPNKQMGEWQGYREINGHKDFVIMKPIVAEERCLLCHSKPEIAPKEMIDRYGDTAGFGIRPGEIIGALSISVPATKILNKATRDTIVVNSIVFFSFLLVIILLNMILGQIVIKPIHRLVQVVDDINIGVTDININTDGSDEISDLAKGCERLRTSINLAIKKLKKTAALSLPKGLGKKQL